MSTQASYPIERRAGEIERLAHPERRDGARHAHDARPDRRRIGLVLPRRRLRPGRHHRPAERARRSATAAWSGSTRDAQFLGACARPRAPPMSSSARASPTAPICRRRASISCTCASSPAPPATRSACCARRSGWRGPAAIVALQDPDGSTLNCYPPHPAWDRLKAALLGAFSGVGADLTLARRLYCAWYGRPDLQDVQYRPFLIGVRSVDPMVD